MTTHTTPAPLLLSSILSIRIMSHLLSLPPELISEITVRLACKDLKALSLVSFTTRQLVLPSLFRNVHWRIASGSQSFKEAHDEIINAGTKIKHAIQYESPFHY
jgi:hypothetical protein